MELKYIFIVLKLIDDATLFSKDEVIKEYENNKDSENLKELLHEKSIFPNGEKLGFYNISKFTFNDFLEKKYGEKEFEEYLNGFNIELQELFNIIKPDISRFHRHPYINYVISDVDGKNVKSKKDIQKIFIEQYHMFNPYFNYKNYSNFLKEVLLHDIKQKENISILHIYPDTHFIFQCFNCIMNYNPKCNVNLYVISHEKYMIIPLKFLAMLNEINFKYIIDNKHTSTEINHTNYSNLFENNKSFDYVIQSDNSCPITYTKENIISDYGLSISSRAFYIIPFQDNNFIYKEWLDNDLLESLILIPIKYKDLLFDQPCEIKLDLLIVLNYNKSKERKNKFIIIDNNKNKTLTTAEYSLSKFICLINNDKIYEKSLKQFLNFTHDKNCNIISIDEVLSNYMDYGGKIDISINDLLYKSKMKSQKNYYKISYLETDSSNKEHFVTKQLDYNIERLENLISPLRSNKTNNSLYFLKNEVNVDKWIFLDFELKNSLSYHIITLNSDKVSLEYLYYFLNSSAGIEEYEYFMRGHPSPKRLLSNIRVPIPPKNVQNKIVATMNKSKNFFNEVNQLKNTINNNFFNYEQNLKTINEFYGNINYSAGTHEVSFSNNWEYMLSGLVWPLAITYLLATSGGFEKVETANNLLRLFEFTTAFNTIVLISGLPEEIYEQYKSNIWDFAYNKRNNDEKFVKKFKLSFGSWVEFTNLLSSAYKKEFRTDLNKEFYTNLLDKQLRKYYNNLKDERNNEFHGGITNAYDAEILINELDIPKAKIFEHLNSCYNNFKLYYITGKHDYITNEYEVIFLNGAYSMPIYSTVVYNGRLEPNSLYLHDTVNNSFSKLNDELIKFKAIDETKRDWRLYIFIGFETQNNTKKAIYRCYQRRENDEIEDINLNKFM